jgi:hypothetical protein
MLADGSELDVRPFARHSTAARSASQTDLRSPARTRASLAGVAELCSPGCFRTGKLCSSYTKAYRSVSENRWISAADFSAFCPLSPLEPRFRQNVSYWRPEFISPTLGLRTMKTASRSQACAPLQPARILPSPGIQSRVFDFGPWTLSSAGLGLQSNSSRSDRFAKREFSSGLWRVLLVGVGRCDRRALRLHAAGGRCALMKSKSLCVARCQSPPRAVPIRPSR